MCSGRIASPLLRLTTADLYPCTSKWDSSENISFLQSPFVYPAWLRAQLRRFFFITLVNNCLRRSLLAVLPTLRSLRRTVKEATFTPVKARSLWRSLLFFFRFFTLFLIITLTSCGVVLCFLPHLPWRNVCGSSVSLALFMMSPTVDFGIASFSKMFLILKAICFLRALMLARFLGVASIL